MLGGLKRLFRETPECPICDGPCTHDFPRSEFVFPENLPVGDPGNRSSMPPEPPATKPNRRGRRPESHAPKGPEEDRMIRLEDDR